MLSGVGLYVQDDDHNEVFLMKVRTHHIYSFALNMDAALHLYRNIPGDIDRDNDGGRQTITDNRMILQY